MRIFSAQPSTQTILRWRLSCRHEIICDCEHYVGQDVFCSKCREWRHMTMWRKYVRPATSDS